MKPRSSVFAAVLVAVAVGLGGTVAHVVAGTRSTTALASSYVMVDGRKAVPKEIVARLISARYRPLLIGRVIAAVSCPTGLKAVAGTSLVCSGKAGGRPVPIPVTVIKASERSVTWAFKR